MTLCSYKLFEIAVITCGIATRSLSVKLKTGFSPKSQYKILYFLYHKRWSCIFGINWWNKNLFSKNHIAVVIFRPSICEKNKMSDLVRRTWAFSADFT